MLTNGAVKAATAQTRAYKMSDSGGLFLFVTPAGCKSWRLKYRIAGREKLLVLGRYPEMPLQEARRRREECKAALRDGRDPASARQALDSFEQLARAWFAHAASAWSTAHAADVLASLERDVLPAIGARDAGSIEPRELLELLRTVEQRGRAETARRLRQRLSAIFGFGIAEGIVQVDPAQHLGRAMMAVPPARRQPAITEAAEARELLRRCEQLGVRESTVLASRFLALTAVRLDAVRGMRWSEVEALDDAGGALWRVPAARMKLKRAKKADPANDHLVPLSAEAVAVLRRATEIGHDARSDALVFPGREGRPIGEGAIGTLYARAGYAGRHVPHGWRSSFSTILNELLGPEARGDIDRALAHSPKDKVEAAYNRAQLLDRRRALFDRWGAVLSD